MSNKVVAKQKRTIIVCIALAVLLLAGSVFVLVDGLVHMDAPYRQFTDVNFAKGFAYSLGKSSVRDLTQEDIDKVESLIYYVSVTNDSSNGYATVVRPIVMLGFKDFTDKVIENDKKDTDFSDSIPENSYVVLEHIISESEDIALFKNLRVLRSFDLAEVSDMQQGCYYSELYAQLSDGQNFSATAFPFADLVEGAALADLKKLDQLSSLTKLEYLSLQYSGITSLEGIEKFENLKKLDIGNTLVTDFTKLAELKALTDLTIVAMGDQAVHTEEDLADDTSSDTSKDDDKKEEEKHTHAGITDISSLASLTNLVSLNISQNAIADISALKGMTKLEDFSAIGNCIENLDALSEIKTIKKLAVSDNHLTDIKGIAGCENLDLIEAYNNKITDVSMLANCTKLTSINLHDNEVKDLGDLSKLQELSVLTVYNNKITSLKGIEKCKKLANIDAYSNEITEIGNFDELDELTYASLHSNKIKDLNGFNGCAKLETLEAYNNELDGTLTLDKCPELSTLTIYYEEEKEDDKKDEDKKDDTSKDDTSKDDTSKDDTSKDDTSNDEDKKDDASSDNKPEEPKKGLKALVIKGLKKLSNVDAHGNALTAVPDLTDCEKLTTVNLSANEITDVSGAANGKVATLNLSNNKITDISALEKATTLASLDLTGNNVKNIDAVAKLTKLSSLTLKDNKELDSLKALESLPTTSSLSLNIVGTKIAENVDAIKELQKKYTTMKITYTETKK